MPNYIRAKFEGGFKIGRGHHITDIKEKDFTAKVMILRMLLKLALMLLENNKMVGQAPPYKLGNHLLIINWKGLWI